MINFHLEFALGLILLLFVVLAFGALMFGAPVIGILRSINFTKKLTTTMKEGRFKDLSEPKVANRIRWFAFLALISMVGFIFIIAISLFGVLSVNSKMTISLLVILSIITISAGAFIYHEIVKRMDK